MVTTSVADAPTSRAIGSARNSWYGIHGFSPEKCALTASRLHFSSSASTYFCVLRGRSPSELPAK